MIYDIFYIVIVICTSTQYYIQQAKIYRVPDDIINPCIPVSPDRGELLIHFK